MTSHDDHDARITALVHAYLDADYRWELDGSWRHMQIGECAPDIEVAFPEFTRFGLISAWNPHSVVRGDHENRTADEALHFHLLQHEVPCRPACSSAPDRSWKEPSWLAPGMPVEVFDSLARRFDQLATLWWRRGEQVRLRIHAPKRVIGDRQAFVDWVPVGRPG